MPEADRQTKGNELARKIARGKGLGNESQDTRIGILFLCLGNICRSPAAEAVFKKLVLEKGLGDVIFCDSCGTGGGDSSWYKHPKKTYNEGSPADDRIILSARKRGVQVTSRVRTLEPRDIDSFDMIVVMDEANRSTVFTAAGSWNKLDRAQQITVNVSDFFSAKNNSFKSVPDPYYGGTCDFDRVLDLLEDGCSELLRALIEEELQSQ